ncbi:hypothetical protein CPB85DRAFT_1562409 [Mucidula mucida]|nr:hypothetical protein CPB85DRAFT_1562409 [Mucidula mucida]
MSTMNETKLNPRAAHRRLAYKMSHLRTGWPQRVVTARFDGGFSSWRPNLILAGTTSGKAQWDWHKLLLASSSRTRTDALRDVVGWERIWGDSQGVCLWRGVPPNEDYVVVGGYSAPTKTRRSPTLSRSVASRHSEDLLVMDDTFKIWNDQGFFQSSLQQASAWKTLGRTGASPSVLIPVASRSAPPRDISFSLDRSKTLLMESSMARDESTVAEDPANLPKKMSTR